MKKIDPYVMLIDQRGKISGITKDHWEEVNFIETKAHQIRGNHYHKETLELFFIINGEIDITIDNLQSGEHIEFYAQAGDIFIIEPYEVHTFYTRTETQWINMLSKKIDTQNPDFHHNKEKS